MVYEVFLLNMKAANLRRELPISFGIYERFLLVNSIDKKLYCWFSIWKFNILL